MMEEQDFDTLLSALMEAVASIGERFDRMEDQLMSLEAVYDDLPPMLKLWNAVAELQDLHDAPASLLGHYLNGQLPVREGR